MIKTNKSLFSKKIKCQNCGSSFKRKKERDTIRYVCSRYDTKGECVRNAIDEDYLIWLLEKRFEKKVDRYLVEKEVQMIMIENVKPYLLEIHLNNQESILFSKDYIRY